MADKPPFDPTQPFSAAPSIAADKPPFDPSQPFEAGSAFAASDKPEKPAFDPTKPFAPAKPVEAPIPMPGPLDALWHGLKAGTGNVSQSVQVAQGQTPTAEPQTEAPEASPFQLRDLYEPSRGLSKVTYALGQSYPTLAAGIAGGAAGSLVDPGLGTAIGGAGGAALGAAFQTIGPEFARELKQTPQDPDGAWNRALEGAAATGAFSGASWAAYPLKIPGFSGALKNMAFQVLGVQPTISMAERATKNVIDQKPVTEGLGEAYTQGAVTTAVPAVGHLALRGRFGEPTVTETEPTPQDIATSVAQKRSVANSLIAQSQQPGISPAASARLAARANDMHDIANFEEDRHAAQQRIPQKIQLAESFEQMAQQPGNNTILQNVLESQARAWRGSAREDSFIGSIPPPLTVPKGGLWSRTKEFYLNNIDPAMRSEAATKADAAIAQFKSKRAQLEDAITHRGEKTYAYKWPKVDEADQNHFLYATETGTTLRQDVLSRHPWMDQAQKDYRAQLDASYKLEKEMGSRAAYIQDYFPHIWKDVQRAQTFFQPENIIRSMGATWFQKSRTYDLIEMGLQNGLELKHNNIQDIINNRLMSGADMVNKMEMLHDLQRLGTATPMETAPPHVLNPKLVGSNIPWQEVSAPNGQKWMIAPDAQALWKNGVEAKGLWSNDTAVGDAFRSWMKLKSAWVPIKLGLSFFHPVHVAHISLVNNMTRALGETFGSGQQGLARRFAAIPEAMLQTVADTFFALPTEKLGVPTPQLGKLLRSSWLTPKENQTASQRADVKLMNEAGISAQLSEQMKIRAKRDFSDALNNNQYLKAIPAGARRGIEKMSSWMFEEWIPNLKVAALKRESESLFRRRPDLLTDTTNRQVALRALGKQIDNRFGEMFYGSLFWNRTLKDASIGSFLSLGWNLGFAREFGGGAFEPIVRRMIDAPNPTRALVRQTTNKTTNMFVYSLTAMAINAAMNKAFTGDNPEGLDYVFPRIGGLNPDGSPRRVTNAFYTREVPMAMKNIEERQNVIGGLTQMLYHKMMFDPVVEMAKNKDYFGNQIYDENSPFYQRAWQLGQHLVSDQLNPMSVAGAKRALQLSGKPYGTLDVMKQIADRDVVMPFLGFGPAPGYASKDAIDNGIMYDFRRYVAPEAKSFETGAKSVEKSQARTEYLGAVQRKDQAAKLAAAHKLEALGVKTPEIEKLQPGGSTQYMFHRLPYLEQAKWLKQMDKDQFKKYFPISAFGPKKKGAPKADPEITALLRKYYAQ